jgi:tRNA dimethylallyltransferase
MHIKMPGKSENTLLVVVGPTAVGKTTFTVQLAKLFGIVVLNADSRQVYQEMNIGTAKPSHQEMEGIKHYFIDDRSLKTYFSAGIFEREALDLLSDIFQNSELAIMSGGSGLYIDAVCKGLDNMPDIDPMLRSTLKEELKTLGFEDLAEELQQKDPVYWAKVDQNNPKRILRALEVIRTTGEPYSAFRNRNPVERPFSIIKIGLDRPRDELFQRINNRVDLMIENGLFDEVEALEDYWDTNALQTVGYQEIVGYLKEEYDKEEAIRLLKRNSRRYAKRQLTWFRRDSNITWFHPDQIEEIEDFIRVKLGD